MIEHPLLTEQSRVSLSDPAHIPSTTADVVTGNYEALRSEHVYSAGGTTSSSM
jgi:hypothetical protein